MADKSKDCVYCATASGGAMSIPKKLKRKTFKTSYKALLEREGVEEKDIAFGKPIAVALEEPVSQAVA